MEQKVLETLKDEALNKEALLETANNDLAVLEEGDTPDAEAIKKAKANVTSAKKALTAANKAVEKEHKRLEREAEKVAKAEAKEAEKAAKAKAKEDAKAAKAEEKAAKAAEREANKMPVQNDVRKPKPGTLTGKVWEIAEQVSEEMGTTATIARVLEAGRAQDLNDATIKTQYARWRKFHGIEGRVTETKVAEEKAETEAPAEA